MDSLEVLATQLGVKIVHKQSNTESELIDFLHKHTDTAAGVLINSAGLTLYGRPLLDAVGDVKRPAAVVHLANLYKRGDIYGPNTKDYWKERSDVTSASSASSATAPP